MLRTRDDAPFTANEWPLEATYLRGGHCGAKIRILARALHDTAPAGVAGNIDIRRKRLCDTDGASLVGRDCLHFLDHARIPGGGHAQWHREDRV